MYCSLRLPLACLFIVIMTYPLQAHSVSPYRFLQDINQCGQSSEQQPPCSSGCIVDCKCVDSSECESSSAIKIVAIVLSSVLFLGGMIWLTLRGWRRPNSSGNYAIQTIKDNQIAATNIVNVGWITRDIQLVAQHLNHNQNPEEGDEHRVEILNILHQRRDSETVIEETSEDLHRSHREDPEDAPVINA